nr:hypothetical protein [Tanacetum cinerariifolium]
MAPKKRTTRSSPATTTTTTTPMNDAQLKTLIAQGVADMLTEHDATRRKNGKDNHDSGTGVRRQAPLARECTYLDFIKCKPLYFKGIERVELALMCARMFPEESDKIERYIGGLPDMIYGSVMESKPKTMQNAIEFTTDLMDKMISTFAERQAKNKRKFEDTSNNNQNQQQNKKQNTSRAYTARSGDKKPYGGSKPLCSKTPQVKNLNALSVEPRDIQEGVSKAEEQQPCTPMLYFAALMYIWGCYIRRYEFAAGYLSFAEVESLVPVAVGGVIVVSELLFVFLTLALVFGGAATDATA